MNRTQYYLKRFGNLLVCLSIGLTLFGLNGCTDMFRSDIVPPMVYIADPFDGESSLSGVVPILTKIYDNSTITHVNFYIDDVLVAKVSNKPFTYNWNTNFWNRKPDFQIRVEAFDEFGNSASSAPISVSLNNSKLTGPQNLQPVNDALVSEEEVTLRWNEQINTTVYQLFISHSRNMEDPVYVIETADTSHHLALERNEYFWYVRARIVANDSTEYFTRPSAVQRFFIGERIFVRQFTDATNDWSEFIFQQPDSSYRVFGTLRIGISGGTRYRLKFYDTDILGERRRSAEYVFFQKPYAALQHENNTIIAGFNSFYKAIWMSIDTSGTILWKTVLDDESTAKAMAATSSGDLYSIVEKELGANQMAVYWVKMTTAGVVLSETKMIDYSSNYETNWKMLENPAGNFYVLGDQNSNLYLYEVNSTGEILEQYAYTAYNHQAASLQIGQSGEILLFANRYTSGSVDGIIKHISSAGVELSEDVLGGAGDDQIYAVKQLSDGGFILTGTSDSGSYGLSDIWTVRLNADCTEQWSRLHGKTMFNEGNDICPTYDGGYAVTCAIGSFSGYYNNDVFLMKTDENGRTIRNWFHP